MFYEKNTYASCSQVLILLYTKVMKIIGHRGARHLRPDNTISGITKAIEHHVDAVEVDVRMTKDHVAVLHHDAYVSDPDGAELSIHNTTYAELLRHKADLTPLDHAIRAIGHRCTLIIEIKPGEKPHKTIEIIQYYLAKGWQLDEFAIASFDLAILQKVKRELPHVQLIVNENWSSMRARSRANRLGTKRINMSQRWLWRGFLRMMYQGGWELSSYPYRKHGPEVPRSWHRYLYATITDRPESYSKAY